RSPQALLLNLRYDFPTEWAAFLSAAGAAPFSARINAAFLPYYVQGMKKVTVIGDVRLFCDASGGKLAQTSVPATTAFTGNVLDQAGAKLTLPVDGQVLTKDPQRQVYAVINYKSA